MKVLHIVPTYLPATRYGGPIYSVHGLCKALAAKGHEVHVFTTSVDGDLDSDVPINEAVEIDGVKVWYYPSGKQSVSNNCGRRAPAAKGFLNRLARRLYYSPQMKKALKTCIEEFDIVHLHSVFLWPTSMAARIAHAADVPYVLSPRGMLVKELVQRKSRWLKTAWLKLIEKKTLEQAARVHVTSLDEAVDMSEFSFRRPQVINIANGVDLPETWLQENLTEDVADVISAGDYVLYFGRINWKKGLDRLLRAWVDVPGWELVIAGNDEEDYLPTLHKVAAESGVKERVNFIPRSISGADREALLQTASLLVLPSYSENFGNVVPEAMVRGVPVVVTEEVGAKGIVEASGGGVVVSADDLGGEMNDLLSDLERLKVMGQKGKKWVVGNLTWGIVAGEMEGRYEEILERK